MHTGTAPSPACALRWLTEIVYARVHELYSFRDTLTTETISDLFGHVRYRFMSVPQVCVLLLCSCSCSILVFEFLFTLHCRACVQSLISVCVCVCVLLPV